MFNFLSMKKTDKVIYREEGSATVPDSAWDYTITLNHTLPFPFTTTLLYSIDGGSTWYSDGASDMKWKSISGHPAGGQRLMEFTGVSQVKGTQVRIVFRNGPFGSKNVLYKLYGIYNSA